MKRGNILLITIFFLLVFGFLIFLIKKQSVKNFGLRNILQNTQSTKTTISNWGKIPTEPPLVEGLTLEIIEPKENALYNTSPIKIIGKTSPYTEVYVNEIELMTNETGNFSVNYNLDEGENLLTIVANDSVGNYTEKEITVFLQTEE